MTNKSKKISLTIPMAPKMELTASRTAAGIGEYMGMDTVKIEEIKLALIEACLNAFEHSNSMEKTVAITFVVKTDQMKIIIQDYGEGFNENNTEISNDSGQLQGLCKRGWGIHLMRSLMDDVKINSTHKGTKITMIKNLK